MFPIVAFKTRDISQGSVATHLRYGGIFSDSIIIDFLLILIVNNLENWLIFGKVKAYKMVPILGHPVIVVVVVVVVVVVIICMKATNSVKGINITGKM